MPNTPSKARASRSVQRDEFVRLPHPLNTIPAPSPFHHLPPTPIKSAPPPATGPAHGSPPRSRGNPAFRCCHPRRPPAQSRSSRDAFVGFMCVLRHTWLWVASNSPGCQELTGRLTMSGSLFCSLLVGNLYKILQVWKKKDLAIPVIKH